MNKSEAERVVKDLDEDQRQDLLMYLAEIFESTVHKEGKDVTYYLATDGKFLK